MMTYKQVENVENYEFEPIKGYPLLRWKGKRPFRSTKYFPAQLKEIYGNENDSEWLNKIFWGDNLQVMSHLLKKYRGKIDLIYLDPPFDSKADYKKKIELKKVTVKSDSSSFEEKQYTDLWSNDEYLQFMYERLVLMKELLSETGSIFLHCDWHKVHHLRCIMDEIFGDGGGDGKSAGFKNEIIWQYKTGGTSKTYFARKHDNLLFYTKSKDYKYFNNKEVVIVDTSKGYNPNTEHFFDDDGNRCVQVNPTDVWNIQAINAHDLTTRNGYPTQKPQALVEKIIKAVTEPGDLVFDPFLGAGTTAQAANNTGRRFIVSDINLSSVQVTINGLISKKANGFSLSSINNYELFRNPVEAKELLLAALEIEPYDSTSIFDGEDDGYKVKIMPVNRIATKEDLNELINNLPYKTYEKRKEEAPNKPVENIMLVCMGHEPGLGAVLENDSHYKLNVKVVDILRDKSDLTFKYDSEASIVIIAKKLTVSSFYPRNLLQKLSIQKEDVNDWHEMVESIMIDWNYDGAVMEPTIIDIPDKNEFVIGEYDIPEGANKIKIKITDLLSESYEEVISYGE
jgi:site-specific DNA-methyltransferase (adenine-specific)